MNWKNKFLKQYHASCSSYFPVPHSDTDWIKTSSVCVNPMLRCIHITDVAVEKQYVLHILVCDCNLNNPACKTRMPYCTVICGAVESTIFSTWSHNWHNFQKYIIERKMCVLIYSTTFSWTFLILRWIQQDIITNYVCLDVK